MIESLFTRLMGVRNRLAAIGHKQAEVRETLQALDLEAEQLKTELRAINDELSRAEKQ